MNGPSPVSGGTGSEGGESRECPCGGGLGDTPRETPWGGHQAPHEVYCAQGWGGRSAGGTARWGGRVGRIHAGRGEVRGMGVWEGGPCPISRPPRFFAASSLRSELRLRMTAKKAGWRPTRCTAPWGLQRRLAFAGRAGAPLQEIQRAGAGGWDEHLRAGVEDRGTGDASGGAPPMRPPHRDSSPPLRFAQSFGSE